jgi:hypothetical protein
MAAATWRARPAACSVVSSKAESEGGAGRGDDPRCRIQSRKQIGRAARSWRPPKRASIRRNPPWPCATGRQAEDRWVHRKHLRHTTPVLAQGAEDALPDYQTEPPASHADARRFAPLPVCPTSLPARAMHASAVLHASLSNLVSHEKISAGACRLQMWIDNLIRGRIGEWKQRWWRKEAACLERLINTRENSSTLPGRQRALGTVCYRRASPTRAPTLPLV